MSQLQEGHGWEGVSRALYPGTEGESVCSAAAGLMV